MNSVFVGVMTSLLTGVISGIVASVIFLHFYVKKKRPKIEISEKISKKEFQGETNYFFKFINDTDSEIFDVKLELTFHKPVGALGGQNLQGTDVKLKDDFISCIPCRDKNDKHNLHAMRIRTTENLVSQWEDESSFLRLTIIAKHSLSGLNKIFKQDYYSRKDISMNDFVCGDNLNIN
jgi:MFS superfamily sulfate permease-like transporter